MKKILDTKNSRPSIDSLLSVAAHISAMVIQKYSAALVVVSLLGGSLNLSWHYIQYMASQISSAASSDAGRQWSSGRLS